MPAKILVAVTVEELPEMDAKGNRVLITFSKDGEDSFSVRDCCLLCAYKHVGGQFLHAGVLAAQVQAALKLKPHGSSSSSSPAIEAMRN